MRILMFAALFSGVLWTRTPPAGSSDPAPASQEATPGQTSKFPAFGRKPEPPTQRFLSPSNRHMFLPSTSTALAPPNNGAQEFVAINPYVVRPATAVVNTECAVPLINVAPASGFDIDPKIVGPSPQEFANIDHMPVVRGLPSCDQVKR